MGKTFKRGDRRVKDKEALKKAERQKRDLRKYEESISNYGKER